MATKDLFLKDDLAKWWVGIARDERFEKVLTYARSHVCENGPTREDLRGVELLAHTLQTLADNQPVAFHFPSSGLTHEADPIPAAVKKKGK